MNWGVMHWGMLAGLGGAVIPVIIHLFNRRRTTVVDWGAMQFLELGRRARIRFRLSELLLLAGRMTLLAIVALAMARPFWTGEQPEARAAGAGGAGGPAFLGSARHDFVFVFDGSASMGRRSGGQATLRDQALAWARRLIAKLSAGDSVAVLVAKDRVAPLVAPASFDMTKVTNALADLPRASGASDLPMALSEALRLLDTPGNPARDVLILTDGQRSAWRPDEPARWALPREIHRDISVRTGFVPRIWVINFGEKSGVTGPNASVGPLEIPSGLVTPDRPVTITTTVSNAGSEVMMRGAELAIDGQTVPGADQSVGPLSAGGRIPLTFRTSLAEPGSHVVTVRLTGDEDALADDDESSRTVEVTAALPVLLIDGEPGVEPLSGETDFLRAALAPTGADAIPVRARVVTAGAFGSDDLKGQRVAVLANVERLEPPMVTAVGQFLEGGGGILVAPGDKVDVAFANAALYRDGAGWLPALIGAMKGEPDRRQTIAHPDPRSFIGPVLAPLGQGESPPLAAADLFQYRVLEPAKSASVTARLDTGDPWIVERPFGKGRIAMLAGPIDAEGGTLPVNPDFVPLAHELIYRLASASTGTRLTHPGEPLMIDLNRAPAAGVEQLRVIAPGGASARATVVRSAGRAQARVDDTAEPGIYQVQLADPAAGSVFAAVAADPRESDLRPIDADLAAALARDLPLTFESDPDHLTAQLFAGGPQGRREIWRFLILATLAGLCLEIWLTRRMVKNSGIADLRNADDSSTNEAIAMARGHA